LYRPSFKVARLPFLGGEWLRKLAVLALMGFRKRSQGLLVLQK
jgi:hypothetical protein